MFTPDYRNLQKAASNIEVARIPLYEHFIDTGISEKILNKEYTSLMLGDFEDKKEFFRNYSEFYKKMGYNILII